MTGRRLLKVSNCLSVSMAGGLQVPLYKCQHAFKEDMHLGSKHQGMCCRCWIMLKRGAGNVA